MALNSILLIRSENTGDNDQTPSLPHTLPVVIVVIVVINGRLACPPAAELQTPLVRGLLRQSLQPFDMKPRLGAVSSFLQHHNRVSEPTRCQQDTIVKFMSLPTRAQFRVLGILRTSVSISHPHQDVNRANQIR